MGTGESSAPSTQGAAFEMQKKEELILDEYTESLIIYEGGSVGTEFVGNRVAESEKTTSISGNNCDGASHSAASRGEDSSDESGETNRQFSAAHMQMLNQTHQIGAVKHNAIIQYSGTKRGLDFLDFEVNVPETHLNFGSLNVSRGQAIRMKEDYEQRVEKRRVANREAARRSRIRRQQECEKLRETAEILESEIAQIPRDIWRLSEQIEKLKEENDIIFDELEKKYGADAVSDLRAVKDSLEGKSNDTDPKTPSRGSSSPDPPSLSSSL